MIDSIITATCDAESDGFSWFFTHSEYEVMEDATQENYEEGMWHPWSGGDNPVHPLTTINVMTANNKSKWTEQVVTSDKCDWNWYPDDAHETDIVAFKVVKHYVEETLPEDADGRGPWVKNTTGEKPEVLDGQELDIILSFDTSDSLFIGHVGSLKCDFSVDHPCPVTYYHVVGEPKVDKTPNEDGWITNDGSVPEVPEGYTLDILFNVGHQEIDTDINWGWGTGDGDYYIKSYRLNPPKKDYWFCKDSRHSNGEYLKLSSPPCFNWDEVIHVREVLEDQQG